MKDEDMEESVEKEDDIVFYGNTVQKDRLRRRVKRIRHQCWLNHDQRIVHILLVQNVPVNPLRFGSRRSITIKLTCKTQFRRDCY
jgi:hypothetical protein